MCFPKITVALAMLLAISFLLLSSNALFPKPENLADFGFSLSKPQNIVFFNFIHVDYSHLIFNLSALLAGGIIVESVLRRRDLLALFFAGSAFSALAFVLINPKFAVVGSSAGATSLLAAAFTVDTKRTVLAAACLMLLAFGLVSAGNYYVYSTSKKLDTEIKGLEAAKQQALKEQNYEQAQEAQQQISLKQAQAEELQQGIEAKKEIPPNFEIHLLSSLFGVLYVWLFCRKELAMNAKAVFQSIKEKS